MSVLRPPLLLALVGLALAPAEGPVLGPLLARGAGRPPAAIGTRVVWLSGEGPSGDGELAPATLLGLLDRGASLVVCDQDACPKGVPAVVAGTRETPVPGKGGAVVDAQDFQGTLADLALERLGVGLPRGLLPGSTPLLDVGQGPLELTPELLARNPGLVDGRVVVVGPADRLRQARTRRGQIPVPWLVAWGIDATLREQWWRPVGWFLELLLALGAAAWIWGPCGERGGEGEAARRLRLALGGALLLFLGLVLAGRLLDPVPIVVGALAAWWIAPRPDPDAERRLAAALLLRARKGEGIDRLLASLPEDLREPRRALYEALGGGEGRVPTDDLPRLFPEELVALARVLGEREEIESQLEALEWACVKDPEDREVARLLEECREEVMGALSLLDLQGIKDQLASRYQDLELLGQGAMGLVLEGRDVALDRPVALKVVSPGILGDDDAQARFFREIEALADLTHPHVVQIYGSYPGKIPHYAMEHLQGETVRDALARGGVGREAGLEVLSQFGEALDYIHDRGILHRDLKPDNLLLVRRDGAKPSGEEPWERDQVRLVVIDFGIAKGPGSRALTRAGDVLGTLAYMSPEQVRGEAVDQRADRFALGVIAYEILAGKPPFRSPGAAADGPETPLGEACPDLPEALVEAVEALLEPDPEDRPGDLGAFRDACLEKG